MNKFIYQYLMHSTIIKNNQKITTLSSTLPSTQALSSVTHQTHQKIYIFTPCYDAMMTMQYTISLLNLIYYLNSNNIDFLIDFLGNESLITRARNKALGKFLQTDCTHLLFIDSDIEFKPEALMELLAFNKDVTCCAYSKKGFNWNRLVYSLSNEINSKELIESRGLDFNYNLFYDENNRIIKNGDFVKLNHGATGFMLIKREIIKKLIKKHKELEILSDELSLNDNITYGLFCTMIKNKKYLSEDYSFCERVNNIGGEVWLNIKNNLNHIGKYSFNSDIKNRENIERIQKERLFYK